MRRLYSSGAAGRTLIAGVLALRSIRLAILFSLSPLAFGQQSYEMVVVGDHHDCSEHGPVMDPASLIEWIPPTPITSLDAYVQAVAPAPDGRVFAAVYGSPGSFYLAEVAPGRPRTAMTTPMTGDPVAMVVDRSGTVYVLVRIRNFPNLAYSILAISSSGALRATYPLPSTYAPSDGRVEPRTAIDLAGDQCTLFLVSNLGPIQRFDVCTGTFLGEFGSRRPGYNYALRALPDGGLLVSMGSPISSGFGRIDRLDASGDLVRSYPAGDLLAPPLALMLRDGGNRLVYGQGGFCRTASVVTIDLETGGVVSQLTVDANRPTSVVPYFAWTAAFGAFHSSAPDVPTIGIVAIFFLALSLAAIAVARVC